MTITPRIRRSENYFAAMANEPSFGETVNCALLEYEFEFEQKKYVALGFCRI